MNDNLILIVRTSKKGDDHDDFYDDEPVSDANVGEIAKSVDADKMDNNLFGKKQDSSFNASGSDFGSKLSIAESTKTVIEKPSSAPGIRSSPKSSVFDDFEIESFLPDQGTPKKPASAHGSLAKTSLEPNHPPDIPPKASSMPLPDSSPFPKGKDLGSSMDMSSSGFTGYMPSTGPSRGVGGSKTVSFAEDRPPTRVGKKSGLDVDYGSDWLELVDGSGSGGGRSSILDDISSSSSPSRRPGTSVTANKTQADNLTKPKTAPGGLGFDLEPNESHRASQAKGPLGGAAYNLLKSEKGTYFRLFFFDSTCKIFLC